MSTRSRRQGPIRLLIVIVVVLVLAIFILPLFFGPRIEVRMGPQFRNPSLFDFQISNQNLTPLTDVDYSCEVSKLILANGSPVTGANELVRGKIRKIPARRGAIGRCETASIIAAPLKTAEYKLTVTYHAYPWPQQRKSVYRITAQVNANGDVTGWKLD